MTTSVIVSKGARADDGLHAIRGCDETTISNRRRRRARRRGPDQHCGFGGTPIPLRLYLTNFDRDGDASTHTSNGHDPGAGLSAEHGARL